MYIIIILSGNSGRKPNLGQHSYTSVCDAVIVYATCWWELFYPDVHAVCVYDTIILSDIHAVCMQPVGDVHVVCVHYNYFIWQLWT